MTELPAPASSTERSESAALESVVPEPWWRSAVIYQVYPRSFADANGDGVGDLRGLIDRLDYLKTLGVDAIWLSPIYRSPQDDNGYDISDYRDVDPSFGSLADLDDLIAGLHERGMRLVMDLVVNHTSDEHAWFVESRGSRQSSRRDWYWWRPARPGTVPGEPGAEPNNWGSFFSGPAWEFDEPSGEYYLHLFSRKQPDLNWENPQVRHAVHDLMRWWLARGVDGFRMDVINMISKAVGPQGELPDGAVPSGSGFGDGTPYFLNGPRIHEFLHELNVETMQGRDLLTVGETPAVDIEAAKLFTRPDRQELAMLFTFEHMDLDQVAGGPKWHLAPLHLPALKANLAAWQQGLADEGWLSLFWCNHDQPRIVSRWGDDGEHRVTSAKSWATVLHLLRGTPYIYQGEELGMTNAGFSSLSDYRDVETLNYARTAAEQGIPVEQVMHSLAVKSRDNSRTPMQWTAGPQAGFTTGEPWIAVNPNHVTINAVAAQADPQSVFHHYRRLIELRHTLPIVVHGRFRLLAADHERLFAYTRELDGDQLVVLANLSGAPLTLDEPAEGELLLGTHPERDVASNDLLPWESRVVLRRRQT